MTNTTEQVPDGIAIYKRLQVILDSMFALV